MGDDWSIELNSRIVMAENASLSLIKSINASKLFPRRTKVHLYTTIIRPTLTWLVESLKMMRGMDFKKQN